MKKQRIQLLIGLSLVLLGAVLFAVPSFVRQANANQEFQPIVAEEDMQRVQPPETAITGKAVHLSVPSVDLEVAIIDGVIDVSTQTWTLTKNKAQFAVITTPPNNKEGNTFIYGHNRKEVFSKLLHVRDGAEAHIKTENGLTFTYVFRDRRTTSPDDVAIFTYKGAPILTLQTCTGLFFQNRDFFTFGFKGVQ